VEGVDLKVPLRLQSKETEKVVVEKDEGDAEDVGMSLS